MHIERNLRTPEKTQHGRYVRVVGDGTSEGTRVLEMNGEPVPEHVVGMRLNLDPHGCAHGVFWHTVDDPGAGAHPAGPRTEQFTAWVLFEPPPAPAPAQPASSEDTRRLNTLERLLAATHCNFTHPDDWTVTVEGFLFGLERDLEFNGDSLRGAIDNAEADLEEELAASRELQKAEDTKHFVVDTGVGAREAAEPEQRLGAPLEARLTIPGPPLAELLAAKREDR